MSRKPGIEQGYERFTLVTAAGLQPDRFGLQPGQPLDQRRAPDAVVGKAQPFPAGQKPTSSWALETSIPANTE